MKTQTDRYLCGNPQGLFKMVTICAANPKKALRSYMHYALGKVPEVISWNYYCGVTDASVKHNGVNLTFHCAGSKK